MKRALVNGLSAFVLLAFLAACCGGGTTKESVLVSPAGSGATAGQELQDLKAAYDQGAINEKEFEEGKKRILKGK